MRSPPERRSAVQDVHCSLNHVGSAASLSDVVRMYIGTYRANTERELEFFRHCPTLQLAVSYAALSKLPSGKRHPHQHRIPSAVLAEAENSLHAVADRLQQCRSFDELHDLIELEIGGIHGVGALMVYDVATRIGAYLRLEPDAVYLHAGTADGAKALGIDARRGKIAMGELPQPLHELRPREVEDCLCIFKDDIVRLRPS